MDLTHAVPIETDLEAELVAAYPLLVRRLTLVLRDGDEAQDVAQAAFARALERRRLFRGGDARGWLYTIGLRLAFNELRRRRRLVALPDEGVTDVGDAVGSRPVAGALRSLTPGSARRSS